MHSNDNREIEPLNPRDLWKNIPTDPQTIYYKPDQCSLCDSYRDYVLIAASIRGRSHANEGEARDDDFYAGKAGDSGWYIMAISDGAGSAEFSRRGSEITCRTIGAFCRNRLSNPELRLNRYIQDLEHRLVQDPLLTETDRNNIGDMAYEVLAAAAVEACRGIRAESERFNCSYSSEPDFIPAAPADYATTLQVAITRRLSSGMMVITFTIGDGLIVCRSSSSKDSVFTMMNMTDSGTYAGETRFITSEKVISSPAELRRRISCCFFSSCETIMLMTDGVYEPFFDSSREMELNSKWIDFWKNLTATGNHHLDFDSLAPSDNTKLLSQWLNFYQPGSHDDRTMLIMYRRSL
jgi:hypothetical protein